MEGYENKGVCAECKGSCCKNLPGNNYPADLDGNIKDELMRLLKTKHYVFDYWEGEGDNYYLRPATQEGYINNRWPVDASWGDACIFFDDKDGCKLDIKERPQSCRALEPMALTECDLHGHTKWHAVTAWKKYQNIIKEIISELGG